MKDHHGMQTTVLVIKDITSALDNQHCAALFIYLSKAFDMADHDIWLKTTFLGLGEWSVNWFYYHLSGRTKAVAPISVPQGSILGPLLVTMYTNYIPATPHFNVHFYAENCDDTTHVFTGFKNHTPNSLNLTH